MTEIKTAVDAQPKVLKFSASDGRTPLSNFHKCKIPYGGLIYPSVEHAFWAQKTEDQDTRIKIRMAQSCGDARRVGEALKPRPGWDGMRVSIMFELIQIKFSDRELARALINTGSDELVSTNEWNDRFWGQVGGTGENWLGRTLMQMRDQARVRVVNDHIATVEDGKIPASTQKEIEEAAKSKEAGEKARYLTSFAMHVLLLQSKLSIMVDIRNGCRGSGSAVERRMLERRIAGINRAISKCGQVWIALMTGKLKPWVIIDPATNEEVKNG